jgi:hypothetical protein
VAYFEWLDKAVTASLAREAIGKPVALRAYLQVTADHGLLLAVLAQSVGAASGWFGSPVSRLFAQGNHADGYLSVLAEFSGGQTALITAETRRREASSVTILIFGNHGTMRYDDAPVAPPVEPASAALVRVIEGSLKSGEPVEVGGGR